MDDNDNMIKLELGTTELTLHSEEAVPAVPATKELTEHYLEQQTLSPEEQSNLRRYDSEIATFSELQAQAARLRAEGEPEW